MKINWKVRLKNPTFWITVIPALIAFAYTILDACDVTPTIGSDEITNFIGMIIAALTTLGVLVDPTTKGISDSERAMSYDEPSVDYEDLR